MSIADKCRSILNENMLNKLDFYRNLYKRRLYLVQNTYEKQALEAACCLFEEYTSSIYPPIREAYLNYLQTGDIRYLRKFGKYFLDEHNDSSILDPLKKI